MESKFCIHCPHHTKQPRSHHPGGKAQVFIKFKIQTLCLIQTYFLPLLLTLLHLFIYLASAELLTSKFLSHLINSLVHGIHSPFVLWALFSGPDALLFMFLFNYSSWSQSLFLGPKFIFSLLFPFFLLFSHSVFNFFLMLALISIEEILKQHLFLHCIIFLNYFSYFCVTSFNYSRKTYVKTALYLSVCLILRKFYLFLTHRSESAAQNSRCPSFSLSSLRALCQFQLLISKGLSKSASFLECFFNQLIFTVVSSIQ